MLKIIKGYIRRLSTPKRNKTIQVDMPAYGEFEATFVHSCSINESNNFSNIIINLTYDISKNATVLLADELKTLLSICGIKFITLSPVSNIVQLFVAGSVYQYDKLIHFYYYNPKYRYNKLLCILKNLLDKIDICKNIDPNTKELSVYNSEIISIKNYEVYTQNISSNIPPEIIDKIHPLLYIALHYDTECGTVTRTFNLIDFLFMYYTDSMENDASTVIYNNRHNFIIGGKKYKSIFDITFKVNDQESSGFNSDIDEILD